MQTLRKIKSYIFRDIWNIPDFWDTLYNSYIFLIMLNLQFVTISSVWVCLKMCTELASKIKMELAHGQWQQNLKQAYTTHADPDIPSKTQNKAFQWEHITYLSHKNVVFWYLKQKQPLKNTTTSTVKLLLHCSTTAFRLTHLKNFDFIEE